MREINIDFIAYIRSTGKNATYCEFDIEDCSCRINELRDFIEESQRTISDVKLKYRELFPINFWIQGYCLEDEYHDVKYSVISNPLDVLKNFDKQLDKEINELYSNYRSQKKDLINKGEFDPIKFENDRKNDIKLLKAELTEYYIYLFLKAVKDAQLALNYELTLSKLREIRNVVAYSSDQKGWSNFNFIKINKDLDIRIKTNFCYGQSSYFIVTLVYKNVFIVPYSFLIGYYNARSIDIIKGTKQFPRKRSSWETALKYAIDCANLAKTNPTQFVNDYVLSEIKGLIVGLEKMIDNPESFIPKLRENSIDDEINLCHVNNLNLEKMLILDDELTRTIVAIKVTDALEFISSLETLSADFSYLTEYINKLYSYNLKIKEDILLLKDKVEVSLPIYKKEYSKIQSKVNKITKDIEPHKNCIRTLTRNLSYKFAKNQIIDEYIEDHPDYKKLLKKEKSILEEFKSVENKLFRREFFLDKLNGLIRLINNSIPEKFSDM